MTQTATLSPVQNRNGRLYKREDLYRLGNGVNGSKLRACQHLIGQAAARGATRVISAASVLSPQNAMAATVAAQYGLPCTVILGATNPTACQRHPSVRLALDAGAEIEHVKVGYNPYLQRAAAKLTAQTPGAFHLPYGISTPPSATTDDLRAFAAVGGEQTANLPADVRTLVIPFGSGNTAAGILYGLAHNAPLPHLERLVLVGIGPDRRDWLTRRLQILGVVARWTHWYDLHGTGWATYGDKMPTTEDGIAMHPTYEGKVVRYLNEKQFHWWTERDNTTCLWIVGGPLPTGSQR
jgi:hypothetical protein